MSTAPPPATYERTGRGYVRADGTETVCVRFYLTRAQRDELLMQKARAGQTDNSAFLVRALDLDAGEVPATESL